MKHKNLQCLWIFFIQICISFLLHRGFVVIPKSVSPKRITENQKSCDVVLSENEVQRLMGIDRNNRLFYNISFFAPKGVTIEDVFDVEADQKFVVKKD